MMPGRKKIITDRLFHLMDEVDKGVLTNKTLDEIKSIQKELCITKKQAVLLRELSRKN